MSQDIVLIVLASVAGIGVVSFFGWVVRTRMAIRSLENRLNRLTTVVEIMLTTQERSQKSVEKVSE